MSSSKKMKLSVKHTPREIAELLESDDELPDSYDEIPDIPAYLNDDRFTKVKPVIGRTEENNLQTKLLVHQSSPNQEPVEIKSTKFQISLKQSLTIVPEHTDQALNNKKILISKGVLTKCDIFLIKSIEEFTTDDTLLWFIDYLNYKAMRPNQRSCLVVKVTDEI